MWPSRGRLSPGPPQPAEFVHDAGCVTPPRPPRAPTPEPPLPWVPATSVQPGVPPPGRSAAELGAGSVSRAVFVQVQATTRSLPAHVCEPQLAEQVRGNLGPAAPGGKCKVGRPRGAMTYVPRAGPASRNYSRPAGCGLRCSELRRAWPLALLMNAQLEAACVNARCNPAPPHPQANGSAPPCSFVASRCTHRPLRRAALGWYLDGRPLCMEC